MKKFKFPLAIVAMVIAVTAAFAFNVPSKKNSVDPIRYHYKSSSPDLVDMQNIANWVAEDPGCGPSGTNPCAIDFNGDLSQLDTYLDTFTSATAVTAAAIQQKD